MSSNTSPVAPAAEKSLLDRALSIFADVRRGEGATAILMLVNVLLLLVCYSVIKTVREPLILLGGGAEVRSYAAAGQAILLMGFVPAYGWLASRVDRAKLMVRVTGFFILCIELFALAIMARVPYVGVAFFIWVGIFNISLVAQFWSFASDLYSEEAGNRLFPVIVMGMTAGAPFGSLIAGRLFKLGIEPQAILQLAAVLLTASMGLYLWIGQRAARTGASGTALRSEGGFRLVLSNPRLRLIAGLVVLLNIVNTTGEYLVARLLSAHVADLAAIDPTMNRQAFIGAFSGDYQFWVNVIAFGLQALVASRVVKYTGLAGVLLALPFIALGGYSLIAVGVGFSVVRWAKTLENATDYSLMNTARQLLWLPMTREEKYKAKQAIDTFFVRSGDVISALVVYAGTHVMKLSVPQFASANVILTFVWLGVAFRLLAPEQRTLPWRRTIRLAPGMAAALLCVAIAQPARAQEPEPDTRQAQQAAIRAEKAGRLHEYTPDALEQRLALVDRFLSSKRPVYLAMGNPLEGAGLAFGPGYRGRFGDTGTFDVHATWSSRNYRSAEARLDLPRTLDDQLRLDLHGNWFDAPNVNFYGIGDNSTRAGATSFGYRSTSAGITGTLGTRTPFSIGGSLDLIQASADSDTGPGSLDPNYVRAGVQVQFDTRTSPSYSRKGGLYRAEFANFHQTNAGAHSFSRLDLEVQRFVPLVRENWVLAFRAMASTTQTADGEDVPYFLMPELGGHTLLRGFSSYRFRDRNRLLLSGEYRWAAGPLMDMAVFVDAGKVTARRADLNLRDLEISPGFGVRLHTPSATVTRIEVARSREGTSVILSFSPSF